MIGKGVMYRCPVCKAEITILHGAPEGFTPVCCNVPMLRLRRKAVIYCCPVCGAEVALLRAGSPAIRPRCCNVDMARLAA